MPVINYSPDLLQPIPRSEGRSRLGIREAIPFSGVDIWNGYELSWLNEQGKPVAVSCEFRFPATSPNIIESKSLKLYLNSFSETRHSSVEAIHSTLHNDLGDVSGADTTIQISSITSSRPLIQSELLGNCIDDISPETSTYDLDPSLLSGSTNTKIHVTETLYSHLLKTNCPVTGQPDWASLIVRYKGAQIEQKQLLAYLVSYRNHAEYHEQCIERIFIDIQNHCQPEALTVYACYTRRGGLDINPFRSNFEEAPEKFQSLR